ncbi:MAG: hypothetical protein KF905_16990 [Flavobacteriales bacterium]|nr:hypothetical protein [Flavobacteriales bacterium]
MFLRSFHRCLAVLMFCAFGALQGHGVLHALEHDHACDHKAMGATPQYVEVECALCAAMLPGMCAACTALEAPVVALLGAAPSADIAPHGFRVLPTDRGRAPPNAV